MKLQNWTANKQTLIILTSVEFERINREFSAVFVTVRINRENEIISLYFSLSFSFLKNLILQLSKKHINEQNAFIYSIEKQFYDSTKSFVILISKSTKFGLWIFCRCGTFDPKLNVIVSCVENIEFMQAKCCLNDWQE